MGLVRKKEQSRRPDSVSTVEIVKDGKFLSGFVGTARVTGTIQKVNVASDSFLSGNV